MPFPRHFSINLMTFFLPQPCEKNFAFMKASRKKLATCVMCQSLRNLSRILPPFISTLWLWWGNYFILLLTFQLFTFCFGIFFWDMKDFLWLTWIKRSCLINLIENLRFVGWGKKNCLSCRVKVMMSWKIFFGNLV